MQLVMPRRTLLDNHGRRWALLPCLGHIICRRRPNSPHDVPSRILQHLAHRRRTAVLHASCRHWPFPTISILPRLMGSARRRDFNRFQLRRQQRANYRILRPSHASRRSLASVDDLGHIQCVSARTDPHQSQARLVAQYEPAWSFLDYCRWTCLGHCVWYNGRTQARREFHFQALPQ